MRTWPTPRACTRSSPGKTYDGRTLIAFGGGGPVHACRVAEKVGITRVLVPSGAGVGSAIGFLRAPVGYEVVRSLYQRFSTFDVDAVNALLAEMRAEAMQVVAQGSFGAATTETPHRLHALCRPGARNSGAAAGAHAGAPTMWQRSARVTTRNTRRFYDRPVPGSDVEIMSYAVVVTTVAGDVDALPRPTRRVRAGCRGGRARRWCATPRPARSRVGGV